MLRLFCVSQASVCGVLFLQILGANGIHTRKQLLGLPGASHLDHATDVRCTGAVNLQCIAHHSWRMSFVVQVDASPSWMK